MARKRAKAPPPQSLGVDAPTSPKVAPSGPPIQEIALVFGTALMLRLLYIWQIRDAPFFDLLMGDARSYDEWGQRIAAGDWIGHDVFYQAPLYPYFLGVIYATLGRSLLLVRVCQAVIGAASCICLQLA